VPNELPTRLRGFPTTHNLTTVVCNSLCVNEKVAPDLPRNDSNYGAYVNICYIRCTCFQFSRLRQTCRVSITMDALISKADAIRPVQTKRKRGHDEKPSSSKLKGKEKETSGNNDDRTLASISKTTSIPRSLRTTSPPPVGTKHHNHIKNPSLRLKLARQSEYNARSRQLVRDAAFLTDATGAVETGAIETEGDLEKTWRLTQKEIAEQVGEEAAKGRREWKLDEAMGPYRCRYTRNGRHLLIAGRNGHVASFDWRVGTMHAEIQLKETCRDVTYVFQEGFVSCMKLTVHRRQIPSRPVSFRSRAEEICLYLRQKRCRITSTKRPPRTYASRVSSISLASCFHRKSFLAVYKHQ
jgi:hypothetical protein